MTVETTEMTTEAAWAFLEALPGELRRHDQELRELIAQGRAAANVVEGPADAGGYNLASSLTMAEQNLDGIWASLPTVLETAEEVEEKLLGIVAAHGSEGASRVWNILAVHTGGLEPLSEDSGPTLEFFGRLKSLRPDVAKDLLSLCCVGGPSPTKEQLAEVKGRALAAISELTAVSA
ncbi:MAG TPA: hypothetical protein VMU49_03435 [Candidatus Acidoferrales bacterium]|nr:hypothetical protein [Candidatus Acidoferrales bacterium]